MENPNSLDVLPQKKDDNVRKSKKCTFLNANESKEFQKKT
jgi:hypothetical protein